MGLQQDQSLFEVQSIITLKATPEKPFPPETKFPINILNSSPKKDGNKKGASPNKKANPSSTSTKGAKKQSKSSSQSPKKETKKVPSITELPRMNIITNPHADFMNDVEEPIWQPLPGHNIKLEEQRKASLPCAMPEGTQPTPKMALGLRSLSPEMRRKRNGIVTNPNFKNVNSASSHGNTQEASQTDTFHVMNGNLNREQLLFKQKLKMNFEGAVKGPAVRPTGLPLKKETPL